MYVHECVHARVCAHMSALHLYYCFSGLSDHAQPLISLKAHLQRGWALMS